MVIRPILVAAAATFAVSVAVETLAADPSSQQEHPPAAAAANCPDSRAVSGMMQQMQALHAQMAAAKTPAERQALMGEHMKTMQGGLSMMQHMGANRCPGSGTSRSMQTRMDMMTMMMQMMMDRH